jgi:peptide-methionine (R)-S-oxide reductase
MVNWNDVIRFVNHGNPEPPKRVEKTDQEWKALLNPESYIIARQNGTERPHRSAMCSLFAPGKYQCICCDTPLFDSGEKFQSSSGWPSFAQPIAVENVAHNKDSGHGMMRVKITCNICDAHLGHVFPDGPAPGGLRYCINAASLRKTDV